MTVAAKLVVNPPLTAIRSMNAKIAPSAMTLSIRHKQRHDQYRLRGTRRTGDTFMSINARFCALAGKIRISAILPAISRAVIPCPTTNRS